MPVKSTLDNEYFEQVRAFGALTERESLTLGSMFDLCEAGRFDLRPPYQRNFVWKKEVGCRLVESVMLNVAIPEIYVRRTTENKRSCNEVVDGRQRCTTLSSFYRNDNPWNPDQDFRLTGCDRLPMLNGLKFDEFPAVMQDAYLNYKLGVIAAVGMNSRAVSALFELLNQNTSRLTRQEIRNASFQGPFNNLCKELAVLPDFKKVISKSLELRMESIELVVRFLAFYRQKASGYSTASGNSLQGFINSEMDYWQQPGHYTEDRGRELKRAFMNAITLSNFVFGKDAFRKKPGAKARISNVLFELVMCGFAERIPEQMLEHAVEIRDALFTLCADPTFNAAISRATGDRNNVTYRFRAWEAALTDILGPSLRMPDDQEFPTVDAGLEHLKPTCESAPEALPETCPPVARKGRPLRLALPRWFNPAGAAEPVPAKVHEA